MPGVHTEPLHRRGRPPSMLSMPTAEALLIGDGGTPKPGVASEAVPGAVDETAAVAKLPAPEVHVVRGEQRVKDVSEEELQEVLAEEVHLAPEDHPDEPGHDEQGDVVGRERLHLVHLPHQPELWEQAHGLLVHAVGDQDLHGPPVISRVEEEGQHHAGGRSHVHTEEHGRVLRGRRVELIAEEAQAAGNGRRAKQLEVGERRLHQSRLHGPDAARYDCQQVRDLGVDTEAVDRLMLPDLVQ
mmetsp:Transcript_34060/g.101180  ORF Transcript_34060/g.101180 Transcript_34060/m.101180 type:complete len:242 (-) Transcript_34060:185-910(-)